MSRTTDTDRALATLRAKLAPVEAEAEGYRRAIQALEHAKLAKKVRPTRQPRAVPVEKAG